MRVIDGSRRDRLAREERIQHSDVGGGVIPGSVAARPDPVVIVEVGTELEGICVHRGEGARTIFEVQRLFVDSVGGVSLGRGDEQDPGMTPPPTSLCWIRSCRLDRR